MWRILTAPRKRFIGTVAPNLSQVGFRGRNDDGNETTATWKATENTNWNQTEDENVRVRFVVDETANGDPPSFDYAIQYNLNSGGWNDVTAASTVVRASASGSVANGTATTRQLSSGTGTFVAGAVDTNNGAAGLVNLAPGNLTEVEFCFQVRSADTTPGDTIELRVFDRTNTLALNAYPQVPTITVEANVDLVIQDATHGHTADNLALTQHNVLAIQDATHGHTADNIVLTQHNVLVIADGAHGHTADNIVLTQHNVLAIQDALHGHTADNVVLTAHDTIALVIADATHGHTADNVALTQHNTLSIQDATHGHTADNISLTQHNVLAIQDARHTHTADNITFPGAPAAPGDNVRLVRFGRHGRKRRQITDS